MPIITIKTTKFELDILPDGSYFLRNASFEGLHLTAVQFDEMLKAYFMRNF